MKAIPYKTWAHLSDALLDFRTDPSERTEAELENWINKTRWPWAGSEEQRQEWQRIHDATRAEFEQKAPQARQAVMTFDTKG